MLTIPFNMTKIYKMKVPFARFVLVAILTLGVNPVIAQEDDPIELPDVVASSGIKTRNISISGSPSNLVQKAKALFKMHGAFKMSGNDRTEFTFEFTESGSSAVELTIKSGGQSLFSDNFSGESLNQALYRAADTAVRKTLGIPGFFSGQLAFISDHSGHSEVYQSDLLFSKVRKLTNDRSQCLLPELSPDGNTLLYTSYHASGFPDIYKIDLNSGRRTPFAAFKGTNMGARFSPDGKSVAMILSGSGNSELYLGNSDGAQLRRLTRTKSLEADPSWSPNGKRIALTSDQQGKPQIFTINADGSDFSRERTDISRNCSEPDWNPRRPDLLAFTAAMGKEFEIAVFSFKNQKSEVISRGTGDAVHPAWLNDGRHIIFTQRTSTYSRLMILDTETGNHSRLSPSELNNASMADFIYQN